MPIQMATPSPRVTFVTNVSAAGTTQGTATALSISNGFNQLTTVAAGAGVILPAGFSGSQVSICNNGANNCLVYPPVGGSIGGAAVNASFLLQVGVLATFTAIDGYNYCVGGGVSSTTGLSLVKARNVSATGAITSADFGGVIVVTAAAAPITLSLPAPVAGASIRIAVNAASLASAVTVAATGAIVTGSANSNNAVAVVAFSGTPTTNAIFGTTSVRGDFVQYHSYDGTTWQAWGQITLNSSLTVS